MITSEAFLLHGGNKFLMLYFESKESPDITGPHWNTICGTVSLSVLMIFFSSETSMRSFHHPAKNVLKF